MPICTCQKFCNGHADVSSATYRRHAPFRISAAFKALLDNDPGPSTSHKRPYPSESTSRQHKRPTTAASTSSIAGPSNGEVLAGDAAEAEVVNDAEILDSGESMDIDLLTSHVLDTPENDNEDVLLIPHPLDPGPPFEPPLDNTEAQDRVPPSPPAPQDAPDPGSADDLVDEPNIDVDPLADALPTEDEHPSLLAPETQRPTAENAPHTIQDIEWAEQFKKALQAATLDNSNLEPDYIEMIRKPPQEVPEIDAGLRHAIKTYLAVTYASRNTYDDVRKAYLERHADSTMLSYDQVKRRIAQLSGVMPITHDMCVNSCLAYTGPFSDKEACPLCGASRWDPDKLAASDGKNKQARLQFRTVPLGPQIQARYRSPEMAEKMSYGGRLRDEILAKEGATPVDVYEDVYHGEDLRRAVRQKDLTPTDSVVLFTTDGAQLYRNKASDCWIYVWVFLDLDPSLRYKKKHIAFGGAIPGPNKPKNLDSFIFPGLHHLAALQREGLNVWNASRQAMQVDRPFLAFGTADTPAMALLDGMVGHHGRSGCRFYCPIVGRHKLGAPHYYPACLRPDNYLMHGCDHGDVKLERLAEIKSPTTSVRYEENLAHLIGAQTQAEYKARRLETGICKPSIFSGIYKSRTLGIPAMFPADLMHLVCLNLTDLLLSLWRGTMFCDRNDDKKTWDWTGLMDKEVWVAHGLCIAMVTAFWPSSFGRPPRNPAEKLSSGYKAWEFLLYVFGLGPALFYHILPRPFWRNFCKLVAGIRIIYAYKIKGDALRKAQKHLLEFSKEFEELYYRRKATRLHFCRHSVHQVAHLAPECARCGPLGLLGQWPIERTIGDLGLELKLDSNPYANLSERGIRRAQVNALKAMIPDLEPDTDALPRGAVDLQENYALLRPMDTGVRPLPEDEAALITAYWKAAGGNGEDGEVTAVRKWGRVGLPNGQIARSAWKETQKELSRTRISRIVKIKGDADADEIAEVQYFFRVRLHALAHDARGPLVEHGVLTLALVSVFDAPDAEMLGLSYGTVWSAKYRGRRGFRVIPVKGILSVVAMIPWTWSQAIVDARGYVDEKEYFLVEKPGLDIIMMGQGERMDE